MNQTKSLEIAIEALKTIAFSPATFDASDLRKRAEIALAKISEPIEVPVELVGDAATPFEVYTDGACKGNPGRSSWGAVLLQNDVVIRENSGFIGHATNQVAELRAAAEGLRMTPVGATVKLLSDSQYTLKGLTEWRSGWQRRGWKTADMEPVKNLEIWLELFALFDERKVTVQWVRGHAGNVHNERCDELANQAIAAQ